LGNRRAKVRPLIIIRVTEERDTLCAMVSYSPVKTMLRICRQATEQQVSSRRCLMLTVSHTEVVQTNRDLRTEKRDHCGEVIMTNKAVQRTEARSVFGKGGRRDRAF